MASREPPGLYVHVPFCVSKCPYCGFYSQTDRSAVGAWLDALASEARSYAGRFEPFDTLYVGGGTPSCLGPQPLAQLFGSLRAHLPLVQGAEVTVEVNPGDLGPEYLRALRGIGVNRISLGLQSLRDDELSWLGRRHTADQATEAFGSAREAGFENIAVDLIYGIRGQSRASWRQTLQRVLALRPEHLSCYMLTIEPNTPLAKAVAEGKVKVPGEASVAQRFLDTSEWLQTAGYTHYEVSSFARGAEHRSVHNSKYWRHTAYLGLGPSAHSFLGTQRWWNVRSVDAYVQRIRHGQSAIDDSETLDARQLHLEALALGLRTSDGIDRALVRDGDLNVDAFEQRGWLVRRGDRLAPSRHGMLFADRMAVELCVG
jgi:oxygen-independent coproporphyrinogen III oxidase